MVLACAYVQGADAPFDQGFQAWLQADPARLEANGNSTAATGSQALAFDSYNTALDAIEAANSLEGPAIRDALTTLDKRDAVTGALSFDANGDALPGHHLSRPDSEGRLHPGGVTRRAKKRYPALDTVFFTTVG